MSWSAAGCACVCVCSRLAWRVQTAKMVPVETLQSMFDEPSSGSNATQKRPACSSGTIIGSSFSSETSTQHEPDLTSALTKKSLERTSSFFWSSPVELTSPAIPNRLAIPALAHAREVALHASDNCAMSTVSSLSFVLVMSQRVSELKSLSPDTSSTFDMITCFGCGGVATRAFLGAEMVTGPTAS